jgi:hypothetical protein
VGFSRIAGLVCAMPNSSFRAVIAVGMLTPFVHWSPKARERASYEYLNKSPARAIVWGRPAES